ncbi:MAG: azoR [Rhodoferax sp.]|nr:azoR [Rhodoferax sp.]
MNAPSSLLHVAASPRAALSNSYRLGRQLAVGLSAAVPGMAVIDRPVGTAPPPAPDARFAAESVIAASERLHAAYSDGLIAELADAQMVVISTPMHNFTVPTALKAWIDQIVRSGRTFEGTPRGKRGLLASKPVYLVVSCGGPVGNGVETQQDFLTPYLHYLLGTIGLTDVRALRVDRLNQGPERFEASMQRGQAWVDEAVAAVTAPAARAETA